MDHEEERAIGVADLASLRFFATLDELQLAACASLARSEQVPAGALILQEGEPADAVRVIRTGRAKLSIRVPGRPEAVVGTLSRGELLGFSALLPDGRWLASARALKPCSMVVLRGPELNALCEAEHGIGFRLMRNALASVAGRLRDARFQLLDVFGRPPEEPL